MNNLFTLATDQGIGIVIFNIILTFALSLFISFVYKNTHRSVAYSQSYINALIMMSVLAAIAMMILGNSLTRALGVLGVFTLIRFRTVVKDPKDATYLFFSLAIGMAIGTNNYVIAIISTFLICAINYFLFLTNYGSIVGSGFLLMIMANKEFDNEKMLSLGKKYLRSIGLLQLKTEESGDKTYYYKVQFSKISRYHDFINEVQKIPGTKLADLVSGRDSAEY